MPRIRCPNCGTSINLENRRQLDYKMIVSALNRGSKRFTDLLKITGLPRKTLSMRLAALCDSGVVVKDDGYSLNGSVHLEKWSKLDAFEGQHLAKPFKLTRRNVLLAVMLVLIAAPMAANVLATMFKPPPPSPTPTPQFIGTFKVHIKVHDVTDLYAWQAVIFANSSELVFVDAVEGEFMQKNAPQGTTFVFADEQSNPHTPNIVLVGNSLLGDISGVNGTGTLATLTFGFKSENYALPRIIYDHKVHETFLLDSNLADIQGYTLTVEVEN